MVTYWRASKRVLFGVAAMVSVAPVLGQMPSDSLPAFVQNEGALVGHYRYVERSDGMKVDVRLNDDHSASYRVTTGETDKEFLIAEGFWSDDGQVIHIHNHAGPVRLEQAAPPSRDPSVGVSVTVTNADGTPAEGLGVTWPGSRSLYMVSNGQHSSPVGAEALDKVDQIAIVRSSDRTMLQTVPLTPSGPNSFQFTYFPSDVEPFDIPAIALDEKANRIEVELGTSYARMDRTPD